LKREKHAAEVADIYHRTEVAMTELSKSSSSDTPLNRLSNTLRERTAEQTTYECMTVNVALIAFWSGLKEFSVFLKLNPFNKTLSLFK